MTSARPRQQGWRARRRWRAVGRPLLAALAGGMWPAPAAAVDLPIQALALVDTASVQPRLELQTTLLVSIAASPQRRSDTLLASLELELGLVDGVQVGLGVPFERHADGGESVSGLGSVELGAMAALVESERLLLATGAALELPASDPSIGEENVSGGPFLLADVRLGAAHLALDAGLSVTGGGKLEIAPDLGAAAYVELGPVVPAVELSATLAPPSAAEVALAPGVFANLAESWQIGASGILGLSDAAPDFGGLMLLCYSAALASESEGQP